MKNNLEGSAMLRCHCLSEMLIVDKLVFENSGIKDVSYNISMQDSYFYDVDSFRERLKRAWKVLFGKPVSYADMFIDTENIKDLKDFIDTLTQMVNDSEQ